MYLRKRKRKIAVRRVKIFRFAFHMMAQVASHGGHRYTANDLKEALRNYISHKIKGLSAP